MTALSPGSLLREQTYRIDELLSVESGMGELYRVTHVPTRSPRALKRLRRVAATTELAREDLALFEKEAQRLAKLSHPGIPRVYEYFAESGQFFFVMDWIVGRNAAQTLADGPWPPERSLDVATQIADVLGYIHSHEPPLIHRDLKPANLMITPAQQAILIDFGIARAGDREIEGRKDTVLFASEQYAPPEQLDASHGRTTPRSDVFALGWTIAHLLTNVEPNSPELGRDRARLRPLLERHLPAELRWFAEVLGRCIEVDPRARFADGGELARALRSRGRQGASASATTGHCKVCGEPFPSSRFICSACGATSERLAKLAFDRAAAAGVKVATPTGADLEPLLTAINERKALAPRMAELCGRVARLDCTGDFDQLLAEGRLRFTPLPHQIEAARDVLRHKRGRALLADEVGLGKTIEALIILEEYRQRGLVKRALILTPPTLMEQWRDEIVQKIDVDPEDVYVIDLKKSVATVREAIQRHSIVIGNIQSLRRRVRAPVFQDLAFDLVIVDEVHQVLSQARSKTRPNPLLGYELVSNIDKKFVLLLSATPIQNTIVDLYEIVNLTRPGQLLRWDDFTSRFIQRYETRADGSRFPILRRGDDLRALLREAVVRHTRDEVMTTGVFPRREARLVAFDLPQAERELYEEVRQKLALTPAPGRRFSTWCLDVADALGAHPEAFAEVVAKTPGWQKLAEQARSMGQPLKLTKLVEAVGELVKSGRKVLIFSRFAAARDQVARALEGKHRILAFHRGISNEERVALLRRFHNEGDALVVDDSAAVGLNLQFCDVVVNYDLPWNPFLIEQRVGRVQRIGQKSPSVWIVNFRVKNTIDEVKLDLCTARLRMFEGVFGQAPTILGALESGGKGDEGGDAQDFDLATVLNDIFLERNAELCRERVQKLEDELERARARVEEEASASAGVFNQINWVDA
jgi:superfamily II DNA or RNA helicase/tRNA A-37 threonylcarbamoyl transferase component Bud32